jgi:SAM-dependent methyltransferase
MADTVVNLEQAKYWNETVGPKWVNLQAALDGMLAPLGRAVIDRLAVAPGERVLDVGCGCGDSTLEVARRVGPSGEVLGVDLSAVMLERARERAAAAGLAQVRFEPADVESHRFPPAAFDVVFSRFGVMFFADPAAAFRNLHGACRAGARLGFVCWQALADNPWMTVPMKAAAEHVQLPPPSAPGAPGPFSFADAARVRAILDAGGFREVTVEPLAGTLVLGGATLDDVVEFVLQIGPTATALREHPDAPVDAVRGAVRKALDPFWTAGGVSLAYAAWLVTARA